MLVAVQTLVKAYTGFFDTSLHYRCGTNLYHTVQSGIYFASLGCQIILCSLHDTESLCQATGVEPASVLPV